jgi:FMN-dependent NADH-azoreductase
MKLLHIDSSPLGGASVSRTLTQSVVDAWAAANPGLEIIRRDLDAQPIAHLNGAIFQALGADPESLTADLKTERALSDTLLDELFAADVIVIGAPMYNLSIPTQLKAWIDRITRAGKTFRYTETGPVGMAGGRKVIIASSRGGFYAGQAAETAFDHQEAYLRAVFALIGITDVQVVRAEGIGYGPEARDTAVANAKTEITALIQPLAA